MSLFLFTWSKIYSFWCTMLSILIDTHIITTPTQGIEIVPTAPQKVQGHAATSRSAPSLAPDPWQPPICFQLLRSFSFPRMSWQRGQGDCGLPGPDPSLSTMPLRVGLRVQVSHTPLFIVQLCSLYRCARVCVHPPAESHCGSSFL